MKSIKTSLSDKMNSIKKKLTPTISCCKITTIVVFAVILVFLFVILTIGVLNDLPTITTEHSPIVEFPSPEDTSSICSKHITQPTPLGLHWTGKFLPNNLYFPNTEPKNRLKRILFRFELADDGIIDGDIPTFTINIFDSGVGPIKPWGVVQKWFFRTKTHDVLKDRLGSTHVPLFYKNKENSDKNEESSDKNETDVGPIGPWKYLKKWFFITKTHCRLGSILSLFYKKKSGKNETNALMGDYCEEIDASTTTENDKNHQAAIVIDTPTATTNYEIVSEIDESTTTTNDKDDELSLMKNQLDSVTHELSETKQQLDALIELLKHHVVKIPQLKKDEDENKKGKNKKDKGENKKDKDEDEDEIKVLESEIDSIFYAGNR
ncbi:7035_t:CDS:2 [Entrophospora sp. SA101]|nr:7035_t:CDS:2 [Entrophospora sp. SA101]